MTGIIVEPIQAEGGDHHGSNAWFQVMLKMIRIRKGNIEISHFRVFKRSAKGET